VGNAVRYGIAKIKRFTRGKNKRTRDPEVTGFLDKLLQSSLY